MSKNKALVLGDSHTHAVKSALKLRGSLLGTLEIEAFRLSSMKNGVDIGDISVADARQKMSQIGPDGFAFALMGGNIHSSLGIIKHEIPFDIVSTSGEADLELANDTYYIPERIFWDYFDSRLRAKDGARLRSIASSAQCKVYYVAPPPPKEDAEHILKRPESKFEALGIVEKGVGASRLRLNLWRLQDQAMRKLCEEWGIGFLGVPDEALTTTGFLRPEYYAKDATHANAAYGELVLKQIEAIVAGQTGPTM